MSKNKSCPREKNEDSLDLIINSIIALDALCAEKYNHKKSREKWKLKVKNNYEMIADFLRGRGVEWEKIYRKKKLE